MAKAVGVLVGGLMTVAGCVFTLQGLGYLRGSTMTGQSAWAIIGPLLAGFGVALLFVTLRGPADRTRR